MRRTRTEAEATRKMILRVALSCFAAKSFARTSYDDIAEKMHMTKGAVTWHFRTKEDLLAALVIEKHAEFLPFGQLEAITTLSELRDFFLTWAETIQQKREFGKFMRVLLCQVEWTDVLQKKIHQRLDGILPKDLIERIADVIGRLRAIGEVKTALSNLQVALLLESVFVGLHREAWLCKRSFDIVQTVGAGLDAILKGIKE